MQPLVVRAGNRDGTKSAAVKNPWLAVSPSPPFAGTGTERHSPAPRGPLPPLQSSPLSLNIHRTIRTHLLCNSRRLGAGREVVISLDGVRDKNKNVMQLKKLNTALFPVRCNDKYYVDAFASGEFHKLGTRVLNHVLDLCAKQNISEIYLHVQTNNEDAINFYKKFGYEITETIKNYYTNIDPPDCFVLSKTISWPQQKR